MRIRNWKTFQIYCQRISRCYAFKLQLLFFFRWKFCTLLSDDVNKTMPGKMLLLYFKLFCVLIGMFKLCSWWERRDVLLSLCKYLRIMNSLRISFSYFLQEHFPIKIIFRMLHHCCSVQGVPHSMLTQEKLGKNWIVSTCTFLQLCK